MSYSIGSAFAGHSTKLRPQQGRDYASARLFGLAKRVFDIGMSVASLPFLLVIGAGLALINPFLNPGPLLFFQTRMGKDCRPFTAVKFRTMQPEGEGKRGHDDPLETDRIPPIGRFLRRSRIDETPQVWNVLRGEMSLIGPRPDIYEHGLAFLDTVPGYRERHAVRPGISGLAQVRMGYAEGTEMTTRKTRQDLIYIRRMGWRLEAYVFLRTLKVLSNGFGAQ
ncbi:MAG: sugar transferase [Pseudomonadota bacterium]